MAAGVGGTTLPRNMDDIILLDVYRAVEPVEENGLFRVHARPDARCPVGRSLHNALDGFLREARHALEASLWANWSGAWRPFFVHAVLILRTTYKRGVPMMITMSKRLILGALSAAFLLCASLAVPAGTRAAQGNDGAENYQDFLKRFPLGVMATEDGEQPRTRVFQYLWSDGDKTYFCTGGTKDVYAQMRRNPHVSFCTWDPATSSVLSVDGPVTFVDDKAVKERALAGNPGINAIYQSADNPDFMLFYIDPTAIYTFDFQNGKRHIKP